MDSTVTSVGLTSAVGSYRVSNTGTHQRVRRRSSIFCNEEYGEEKSIDDEEHKHKDGDEHVVVSSVMMREHMNEDIDHGISKGQVGFSMV